MSLNQPRTRRLTDSGGATTGKRGRPESLVRKYWADIGVEGVGPKCVFCDHRSVTRVFRAPPATRHTLICKSAPEDVKKQLRSATNNKYSRRAPQATDPSVGGKPGNTNNNSRVAQQPQGPPRPSHQEHYATASPQADTTPLPAMPSPRHMTAAALGAVAGMTAAAPHHMHPSANMDSVVAPVRTTAALLGTERGPRGVPTHVTSLAQTAPSSTDILYSNNRVLQHDDLGLDRGNAPATGGSHPAGPNPGAPGQHPVNASAVHASVTMGVNTSTHAANAANAALAAVVVETLFGNTSRKKVGPVPTPGEFRAALHEFKERAISKAKRQRNEARDETIRFQNAISMLVGRSVDAVATRPQEPDSDDSDDELPEMSDRVAAVTAGRRSSAAAADWSNGYDRVHK